ncbi:MAG: zf-HC2 domain-containing protein [Caldiserica bacterium]|jgi:anti-sigma factor RsiW|nr:zf-HC2 domain-containing protein [Caldisericota bacterium]MDH7562313.1 zf-HC2 domain-containing protein [Caldisericota bacterium]
MMRCEESISLMPAYLEGELSPEKLPDFEDHLSSCPSCKGKLSDLIRNRNLLLENRDKIWIAPRALKENVLKSVHREKERLKKRAERIRSGLIGLIIGAGAALLAILLRGRRK